MLDEAQFVDVGAEQTADSTAWLKELGTAVTQPGWLTENQT